MSIHEDNAEGATTHRRVETLTEKDQLNGAAALFRTAMVGLSPAPDEAWQGLEPGRTLGAFVHDDLVGTADSYSSQLVVPGGDRVSHAAVTHIGVLPTHTRRGIVSALVQRQLSDFAARGELVASLRASEGGIYERFGYGVASDAGQLEVSTRRARLRDGVVPGGPVRLVDPATSWDLQARIYRGAARWVGAMDRYDYWWRHHASGHGTEPSYLALHGVPGHEDGYVRYHPVDTADWFTSRDRAIVVEDFVSGSDRAYAGLIHHLVNVDLVDRIVFNSVRVDDPLPHLFTDPRAVRTISRSDETWLRLIDVHDALSARRYAGGGSVRIRVEDRQLPANTGTYRVGADGVARTEAPPDLSVDVATLGALYLGGSRWWQLVRAGQVTVHGHEAVNAADAIFSTDIAPYSGTLF